MGKLLITRDDHNNYSRHLDTAVCPLLTTSADSCKNAILPLGNPCSIRWTTGTRWKAKVRRRKEEVQMSDCGLA